MTTIKTWMTTAALLAALAAAPSGAGAQSAGPVATAPSASSMQADGIHKCWWLNGHRVCN